MYILGCKENILITKRNQMKSNQPVSGSWDPEIFESKHQDIFAVEKSVSRNLTKLGVNAKSTWKSFLMYKHSNALWSDKIILRIKELIFWFFYMWGYILGYAYCICLIVSVKIFRRWSIVSQHSGKKRVEGKSMKKQKKKKKRGIRKGGKKRESCLKKTKRKRNVYKRVNQLHGHPWLCTGLYVCTRWLIFHFSGRSCSTQHPYRHLTHKQTTRDYTTASLKPVWHINKIK